MAKSKRTANDGCPVCGGELKAARVPTATEYAKAFDKENPASLPAGSDTATADQRDELGALHTCRDCAYKTRIKAESASETVGA